MFGVMLIFYILCMCCVDASRRASSRSSSPALVPKVPLLKLAQALARLKPPSRGWNASLELLRSARDLLSAVLPSLPSDSWPLPRH
jgi:hypothetical protein